MSYMGVQLAQAMERLERDYRASKVFPEPTRITMALDAQGLSGPAVDAACLAAEPDVDLWEIGAAAPSWEQLVALAALCGVTPAFLFRDGVPDRGVMFACGPSGCDVVEPTPYVSPFSSEMARVIPLRRRA